MFIDSGVVTLFSALVVALASAWIVRGILSRIFSPF